MNVRTASGFGSSESFSASVVTQAAHAGGKFAAESTLVTVYSMSYAPHATGTPELAPVGKLVLSSRLAGPNIFVLRMRDNNMAPTVQRGAYMGVNTADVLPSGGIFVLKYEYAGMLVRRVFLDCASNQYILRSDASGHPESRMPEEKSAGRLVGRVVWVIQEVA